MSLSRVVFAILSPLRAPYEKCYELTVTSLQYCLLDQNSRENRNNIHKKYQSLTTKESLKVFEPRFAKNCSLQELKSGFLKTSHHKSKWILWKIVYEMKKNIEICFVSMFQKLLVWHNWLNWRTDKRKTRVKLEMASKWLVSTQIQIIRDTSQTSNLDYNK